MTHNAYDDWISSLNWPRLRAYAEIIGEGCPWFKAAQFVDSTEGARLFSGDIDVPVAAAGSALARAKAEQEGLEVLCARMNKEIADWIGDATAVISEFSVLDLGRPEHSDVFRIRVEFDIKAAEPAKVD